VQEEVKRFLQDPNHGHPITSLSPQLEATDTATDEDSSSAELPQSADRETVKEKTRRKSTKRSQDPSGKMVDVVLSDMSEPWPLENTNYWKRSLSDPYIRMMNTSGINYKDHAGSMVRYILPVLCLVERQNLPQIKDLCSAALQFAYDTLKIGGHFVCKFYQGAEDKQLEGELKKMFRAVYREKPESSRNVSLPCTWAIRWLSLTETRNLRRPILLQ
jgi:21S rRNA (uridine2791-2'-O)-methyltransferase